MTETTQQVFFDGISTAELARALAEGTDHGGNPIEPFVDAEGGWPLRCCLERSRPGELIAIIAWSPFSWSGPYRETGPVVVHAGTECAPARDLPQLPAALDAAAMTLRPYRRDRTIAYEHVRHVPAGGSLTVEARRLLQQEELAMVHGRNVTGGCFAFAARRADRRPGSNAEGVGFEPTMGVTP